MILDFRNKSISDRDIVQLPIAKSLCNRALILSALSNGRFNLSKISDASDSSILASCLNTTSNQINVKDAGTAMRFLTAYFAFQERSINIYGSQRMRQRPIGVLVDALNSIGANITYLEKVGFPPVQIEPCNLNNLRSEISISAETSSQFISALMLIAPSLEQGLTIHLKGKIASKPYIEMTHHLLRLSGVQSKFTDRKIIIPNHIIQKRTINLESDWSAASYFYGFIALQDQATLQLSNLYHNSSQGDAILTDWFEKYFGVSTSFNEKGVIISNNPSFIYPSSIDLDFTNYPDLAQTIVVLCACLGIKLHATGLESLNIKETNRIEALNVELEKVNVNCTITRSSIKIDQKISSDSELIAFKTYQDHRMAMALSLVSFIRPIQFDNETVVSKSFPRFFSELNKIISA